MAAYESLARWYDALTGDVPYDRFADWYETLLERAEGPVETVLDLACGTGTLSCLLAGRGYEMIGVDASCHMLAQASDKAAQLPEGTGRPMFLCQELTQLDLYGTVDAAICSLDGFNYLPGEDIPRVLDRLRLFIRPGGLLVFDLNAPDRLRSLDGSVNLDETEDMLCLWRAELDEELGALIYGMDLFSRQGRLWRRDREEHIEYLHEPQRIIGMLGERGFMEAGVCRGGPQEELGRVFIAAVNGRRV